MTDTKKFRAKVKELLLSERAGRNFLRIILWSMLTMWLFELCMEYAITKKRRKDHTYYLQAHLMTNRTKYLIDYYQTYILSNSQENMTAQEISGALDKCRTGYDTWGNEYQVQSETHPVGGVKIRLVSLGRDEVEGGTELDTDWVFEITNSEEERWKVLIVSCPKFDIAYNSLKKKFGKNVKVEVAQ